MWTNGTLRLRFKIIRHCNFNHAAIERILQGLRQSSLENRGELVGNDCVGKAYARDNSPFRPDKNSVLNTAASGHLRPICAVGNILQKVISLAQQLKAVNRLLLGTCDTAQPIMPTQAVKSQPEGRSLIVRRQHVKHTVCKQARVREDDSNFYLRGRVHCARHAPHTATLLRYFFRRGQWS